MTDGDKAAELQAAGGGKEGRKDGAEVFCTLNSHLPALNVKYLTLAGGAAAID